MPPDDDLFAPNDPSTGQPAGNGHDTEAEAEAAARADDPRDKEIAELRGQLKESIEAQRELTETLRGLATQRPAPPEEPEPRNDDDPITAFTRDPNSFIDQRAERAAQRAAQAGAANDLASLNTLHELLVDAERAKFDTEFGEGAFDELVKPDLTKNFTELRNAAESQGQLPTGLSSRPTIQALIDRIKGNKFSSLTTRAAEAAKAREEAQVKQRDDLIAGLPRPGLTRTPGARQTPSEEAKAFAAEIRNATGEDIDVQEIEALRGTGGTLSDFLKATKAAEKSQPRGAR